MTSIPIYVTAVSNRLRYVLDWLFTEQLRINYSLTTDAKTLTEVPFFISYGASFRNALSIPQTGLLFEKGIKEHTIKTGAWNNIPVLFAADGCNIPFDLFSAVFFLLSRYEEYYSFTPDKHGRYPATQSILYKNGWLLRPLLDEWVYEFRTLLQTKYKEPIPFAPFSILPTYDIDIAWSYKHKGSVRTIGAYTKDLLAGNFTNIGERSAVLLNKKNDPYDSFDWLIQLHKTCNCNALFFILSSLHTTAFDKNISPDKPAMQKLIKNLSADGNIGIHPSYYSNANNGIENEKNLLSSIINRPIHSSRQHYIKMNLPDTYHQLIAAGITTDYSMGYGTHLGFRAATGQSFIWYDIANEQATTLRIFPFCFMDTTALYEEGLTATQAFERLSIMMLKLKQTGSLLTTVFHNFSLGYAKEWEGWKEAYEQFMIENASYFTS